MSFNPEHTHFDPEGAVNRVYRLDVTEHDLPQGMMINALVERGESTAIESYQVNEHRIHLLDERNISTSFFVAEGLMRVNEAFVLRSGRGKHIREMSHRVLEMYVDAVDFSKRVSSKLAEDTIHGDLARD